MANDKNGSTIQTVAMIFGVGFLVAAVAGFVATGFSEMDANPDTAPRALGLFPVNVLHNVIHLLFGIWGLAAARTRDASRTYCRTSGVIYLVLILLAFVDETTFGLVPIGNEDILLHAVLALPLLYFGFAHSDGRVAAART